MNHDQFIRLYKENYAKVLRGIYRLVGNDAVAEELMQETFLQFLRIAERENISMPVGLLFRISHNLAIDHLKKYARVSTTAEDKFGESKIFGPEEMEYRSLRYSILESLKKAGGIYLQLYQLRVDYEMEYAEIARILNKSERSVYRSLERLKEILSDFK